MWCKTKQINHTQAAERPLYSVTLNTSACWVVTGAFTSQPRALFSISGRESMSLRPENREKGGFSLPLLLLWARRVKAQPQDLLRAKDWNLRLWPPPFPVVPAAFLALWQMSLCPPVIHVGGTHWFRSSLTPAWFLSQVCTARRWPLGTTATDLLSSHVFIGRGLWLCDDLSTSNGSMCQGRDNPYK